MNIVKDDIESLQQSIDFSKAKKECKLQETCNTKTKAILENLVKKCNDTRHNICNQRVCEVTEHKDLEKSARNLEEIILGHKTIIKYQEAIIEKDEKLIERRTSKDIENREEEFHDPLEDLSCKEDKSS